MSNANPRRKDDRIERALVYLHAHDGVLVRSIFDLQRLGDRDVCE